MTAIYDIYVFKTDQRFFLYPHRYNNKILNDDSINEILMDCACLYRLDFETMHFTEKIESVRPHEIDGIVISWMCEKGMECVRGGSFADPVLSDSEKDHISKQIKYMNYELDENAERLEKLHKFAQESPSNLDQMIKTHNSHLEYKKKIEKYSPRATIFDLVWLRGKIETCQTGDYIFLNILPKYENVISRLTAVYEQYLEWMKEDDRDVVLTPIKAYFEAPRLYFDRRVIHEERRLAQVAQAEQAKQIEDEAMFTSYELMIYTLQNRVVDFKFEIEDVDFKLEEMKIWFASLNARQRERNDRG
jgi:hypothetical protein